VLIHVDKPNRSILVSVVTAHVDDNVVGFVSFGLYLAVVKKLINLFLQESILNLISVIRSLYHGLPAFLHCNFSNFRHLCQDKKYYCVFNRMKNSCNILFKPLIDSLVVLTSQMLSKQKPVGGSKTLYVIPVNMLGCFPKI